MTSIRHECIAVVHQWTSPVMATEIKLYHVSRAGFDLLPGEEHVGPIQDTKSVWWKNSKLENSDIAVAFFCYEPPIATLQPESNIEMIQEDNDGD